MLKSFGDFFALVTFFLTRLKLYLTLHLTYLTRNSHLTMTFILDYGPLTGCGFIVFAFLHITLFFLSFHNVWCIVQGVPMKVNSLSRNHTPWSLFPSRWYTLNISFDCFHLDNCVLFFMLMLYTTCEWINLLIKLKLKQVY